MHVPEEVRQCVVFLVAPTPIGQFVPRGTAFLVVFPLSDPRYSAGYLVAAKHTADKLEGKRFGVRFNHQNGDAATVWVDEDCHWWRHPVEPDSVDAAVMPFALEGVGADIRGLPIGLFLTDEMIQSAGIGIGDEVFMTGLFVPLKMTRNEPIVRTGNLAAIPRDRVPGIEISGRSVEAEVYLVEIRSLAGISGSPVFVRETVSLNSLVRTGNWKKGEPQYLLGAGPFWFLGLMHGHWTIRQQAHNEYEWETSTRIGDSIAVGIAVVVPAKKILEILDQPGLAERRDRMNAALTATGRTE